MLIVLLILGSFPAFGQNDYRIFQVYESFAPDSTGSFLFAFDNVNFFRNNEYKGETATGYTLTGAWLRPKLVYYPAGKLRMELGGHVLKYNGRDDYQVSPWFNVHYQPTKSLAVILGNLNSDQNHHLTEPIADPERFLTAKPEAGLQVLFKKRRFTADLWIDWQQFILEGDPYKEQFAFGTVARWKIMDKDHSSLTVPLAFYGWHQGGEIDTAPGLAKSYISVTPGLSYNRELSRETFRRWGLQAHYSMSTYPEEDNIFNEKKGYGFYINGTMDTRFGGWTLSYWHGHKFYTPQGSVLYKNLNDEGTKMIPENKLLSLKYHFDHEIMAKTFFGFVFDYYYDTIQRQTMNSAALYLVVNFGVPLPVRK